MSQATLKSPVILTCALVGAELTREQAPYLPISPDEIAASAIAAWEAGAAMVHLHVRDSEGKPTCSKGVFLEVIRKIRKGCDVIVQVSTGGAVHDSYEDRFQPVEAGPEMASLTTGSINFGDEVFLNPRPFVGVLAQRMRDRNIRPEIEVFDAAMLEEGVRLGDRGLIAKPLHFNLVFGVPGALSATKRNLEFLIAGVPEGDTWSLTAIGRHQFPMVGLALQKGGHIRVGMEDNLYLEKGVPARSNAELVNQAVQLVKAAGRKTASSAQAREILGLR